MISICLEVPEILEILEMYGNLQKKLGKLKKLKSKDGSFVLCIWKYLRVLKCPF